jgi:hypothetical protein
MTDVFTGSPGGSTINNIGGDLSLAISQTLIKAVADISPFGTGSDGDHTVVGTEEIASGVKTMNYRDLTVPAGTVLKSHKDNKVTIIFVSRTLTLEGKIQSGNEQTPSGSGTTGFGAGGIAPQAVIVVARTTVGSGRVDAAGRAGAVGANGSNDQGGGADDVSNAGFTLGRTISVASRAEKGANAAFAVHGIGGGKTVPGTTIQTADADFFAELANLLELHPLRSAIMDHVADTEGLLARYHWTGLAGETGGSGSHSAGGGGGGGEGGRYWFDTNAALGTPSDAGDGGDGGDGNQFADTPKGGGGGGGGGCGCLAILYTLSCADTIIVTADGGPGGQGGDGTDAPSLNDRAAGGGGGGGGSGGWAGLYAQAGSLASVTADGGLGGQRGLGFGNGMLQPGSDGVIGIVGPTGRAWFLPIVG